MAVKGCTCRSTSTHLCPVCTGYATKAGVAVAPPPARRKPTLPSLQVHYPEEAASRQLQEAADLAGWLYEDTWNPTGRFAGYTCLCVRGTELVYIQVRRERTPLSPWQQQWLAGLRDTGTVEVWDIELDQLDAILTRLTETQGGACK